MQAVRGIIIYIRVTQGVRCEKGTRRGERFLVYGISMSLCLSLCRQVSTINLYYWECYIPMLVFLFVNLCLIFLSKSERPIFSKVRYSIHISTQNQEVGCRYQRYSCPHCLLELWNALVFLKNQRFLRTPTY